MSFEPAMTLVLEQIVSKYSFTQIRLIISNIELLQTWLLKVDPPLDIFKCIFLKFLDCSILVVKFE